MSTLGSTAHLVPVHNLWSPSITIFGICHPVDRFARVHVRNGFVPIEDACQHLVAFDVDWSSVSTTRIFELVVDCVVALSATAANVNRLSSGAGLPAATTVPPFELCMVPCSNCSVGFLVGHSSLRWFFCLHNFIVHDSWCSCSQIPQICFDPACSQHAILLFGPPHLIKCSRAMHSLSPNAAVMMCSTVHNSFQSTAFCPSVDSLGNSRRFGTCELSFAYLSSVHLTP